MAYDAYDRSLNPRRVVGPRPAPKYDGPDLLQPTVTVKGKTGPVADLNWMMTNAKNATKVVLDRSPQPGVDTLMTVTGEHPNHGEFQFRTGFRDREQARLFVDNHLGGVTDRETRLRDGGY